MNNANDKIQNFIERTFLTEFDDQLTPQTNLFKEGIIDSFGYIQLMKYLEKEYNIKFSEEDMLSNISVSLDAIQNKVKEKIGNGSFN